MTISRKRPTAAAIMLAGILLAGLILRLWGIRHGLPVVYNLDEYAHFVVSAVNMFGDGLNPHYFQNPPAFTYLLHVLYSIAYGVPPVGSLGKPIHEAFNGDPTTLYLIARVTSAVLGVLAAWVLYFTGKRAYGTAVGLIATAFLCFTFLPVHYSHFALNDVPTLLPLCIGMFGLAGVIVKGRLIDYLIAGLGLGLATATKYTAAALAVSIVVAWAIRAIDDREAAKREFGYLFAAGVVSAVAFVVANPYSVLDADAFLSGVSRQQRLSAGVSKLGTDDTTGWQYYIWTLTWGWGVLPLLLSVVGAVTALWRNWRRALPWVVFVLVVWLFMGKQERFYARWLMPVYPVLAIFAGVAVVELVRLVRERWRIAAGVAVVSVALVAPLVHVVHNNIVMTRDDTRDQAKAWLLENVGEGERIAIELIGPRPYFNTGGERGGEQQFDYYPLPRGTQVEKYAETLSPALLDTYAKNGYCHVVIGSIQKGRVTKAPELAPASASRYYAALEERAQRVATFSPVKAGSSLPRFNFDISYNWYPLSYERPGPKIEIYRLTSGVCAKN